MEILEKAKTIRLRNRNGKYLVADDDEKSVRQDRNGSTINAKWTVELVDGQHYLRLKSCYGKYLTASNMPVFFLGVTGRKVLQTLPNKANSSTEWEIESDGCGVLLKTRYGHFLRPHRWLPPWRNSVSHDIPYRTRTLQKILWEVDVLENEGAHRRAQSDSLFTKPTPFASALVSTN